MAFGLFKKKDEEPGKGGSGNTGGGAPEGGSPESGAKFTPNPATARKFFDPARTVHDSTNYEYAMTLWLQGLGKDPTSMSGLEGFVASAEAFAAENPKLKGPTKEQTKNFEGKTQVDRYLQALLNWGVKTSDYQLAIKALEAAAKLGLDEPAYFIGTRALRSALEDPKVKKDQLVTLMQLFSQIGAFDRAVQAGEAACRLDPTDAKLQAETRNLSAQATMNRGGYDKSGAAGGFRANVRDIEAQRKREEEERLVKSEDALDRVVMNSKADYETRPNDPATIQKFAKSLLERGTAEDEAMAFKVLMKGFETTRTYRFKQLAGDIKLRVQSRKIIELRDAAKETPEGSEQRKQYMSALRQFREAEIKEFEERVENYPTDLKLKYELGRRYYDVGNHEKAIEQFQVAQQAPGIANLVQNLLGQSFLSMGWLDEAEGTFRRAIETHEVPGDDLGLSLRYNLMVTLTKRATEAREIAAAEEAFKLASGIAIQQINFRDIRERREQLQNLVKELRTPRG